MKKTFRKLLEDGGTEVIRLSTNNGLTGYRISDFKAMPNIPGNADAEFIFKVFANDPGAAVNTVNFDDPQLLATAYFTDRSGSGPVELVVVSDHVKINQDIFVTLVTNGSSQSCNYQIELEQIKLDKNEATVATLKDMRGRE